MLPETEVPERPSRRVFSRAEKLRILAETDAGAPGQIAAVLRREGIYSSYLNLWRKQRDRGELDGRKVGRKVKHTAESKRIAELEKQNQRLQQKLRQAEKIIEVQKKLSELLGIGQPENGP